MIRVSGLSVAYGAVQALRDVSFVVETGTVTAVVGANGAGKTTLLRTISGLVRPKSGSIDFDGQDLVGRRPEDIARLGIGHVPEGRGVIEEFTVEENLRLGALHGKGRFADGLDDQFALFPALKQRRRQHAGTLSGGERQMLVMARALIGNPTLLLLDEPSVGLAPQVTASVMSTIRHLCEERHLTVVLVEQDAMSALRVADRAVVLQASRVAADDSADVVLADEGLRRYYLGMAS
ncbi:MAG: ABC transporter ATP-binding protein [Acidimicrobiales bacterium]